MKFCQGNQGSFGGTAGDLIIRISVKPDPYFRREGNDIYTDYYLTIPQVYYYKIRALVLFEQAVLGDKINVKTLDGMKTISIDKGTQPGDRKKISSLVNFLKLHQINYVKIGCT